MKKSTLLTISYCLLYSFAIHAQTDSVTKKPKPQFRIGAFYNSGLNYYGRTDSLQSSGFFPIAELRVNHFYITAAPVFVINNAAGMEYAGSVVTAGLQFMKEKKYNTNIYFVKPIYKKSSELVQSALKLQAVANYTWLTKIINITAGADFKLSDKMDYGATAGLDHAFRYKLNANTVLVIDPSAYINTGTQQFTKTSYKQSGFLLFPGVQQQVTEQVSKFNILSYEFSMPVVLAKGKFQFIANPAYVLPQNLIAVPNRPDLSERGKNLFYITVGTRVLL
jgi:hypothetical protein